MYRARSMGPLNFAPTTIIVDDEAGEILAN